MSAGEIRMRTRVALAVALASFALSSSAASPRTYEDAKAIWDQTKDDPKYGTYLGEFMQFSNHFHLDERDHCYGLSRGSVSLMLVITHPDNGQFAIVEEVFTDVENLKSQCFKKSYLGIRTKIPPILPFVLKMTMSGGENV